MKQVLVVEAHPLTREGYKAVIERQSGFRTAGEAATAGEGIRCFEALRPDLTVVDIALTDMGGVELTRKIRRVDPQARVLMVGRCDKIDCLTKALSAGALGYVLKESPTGIFVQGLAAVSEGRYYLDTSLSKEVVYSLVRKRGTTAPVDDDLYRYGTLTPRQQEILRLLGRGRSVREIAERLGISDKTVRNHLSHIMGKLNANSVLDLVRYAVRVGVIDTEEWKQ